MTTNFASNIPSNPAFPENISVKTSKLSKISWSDFQSKYLHREDGYTYEWLNGIVEKTKSNMDQTQFFIVRNLQLLLKKLFFEGKVDGEFMQEGDLFFLSHHRKPDIAYFTSEQIDKAAIGEKQVPAFVIEIISTTDGINRVNNKMQDYRAAGVQIVWNIFPIVEEIHIYFGENLDSVMIIRGDKRCSASPVLPDFEISAADVFKKTVKKPF
jgi:Uma2 family endonuclease